MCIAIAQKKESEHLSLDMFRRLNTKHPDGMGMCWVENGNLRMYKILERYDLFHDKYIDVRRRTGSPILVHFRKETHGGVKIENCHPFFVNDSLAFIHNGTIKMENIPDDEVDTVVFRDRILRNTLPSDWMECPDTVNMVGSFIQHSKLAFLRSDGEVFIINEEKGTWKDGVWFSNYSFRNTTSYNVYNADNHADDCGCYWCKKESEWEDYTKSSSSDDKEPIRVDTKEDAERYVDSGGEEDGWGGGYLFMGVPFCNVCFPPGLGDSPDVYNIDDYYVYVKDGTLFTCDDCGHTIYPSRSSIQRRDQMRISGEAN